MPGPDAAVSQGEIVALLLAAAGVALLVVALAVQARPRPGSVRTRARAVLVGALLLTAGLALLLVRRLDPVALSRVLANVTAAVAATVATQQTRRPTMTGQLDRLDGRRHEALRLSSSPQGPFKELT